MGPLSEDLPDVPSGLIFFSVVDDHELLSIVPHVGVNIPLSLPREELAQQRGIVLPLVGWLGQDEVKELRDYEFFVFCQLLWEVLRCCGLWLCL